MPEQPPSQLGQSIEPFSNREEMVDGQFACLAREARRSIGKEDLGFAHTAGIKQEMSDGRIARRILEADAEVRGAEGKPAGFATPSGLHELRVEWKARRERVAGLRRIGVLEPRDEMKVGTDANGEAGGHQDACVSSSTIVPQPLRWESI